jgi:hypothetical protein
MQQLAGRPPPLAVSHERLDSKHKSSSIAGTAGLLHQA